MASLYVCATCKNRPTDSEKAATQVDVKVSVGGEVVYKHQSERFDSQSLQNIQGATGQESVTFL